MTNCFTKETVGPVPKKQELSPSEQSLWSRDSLQTVVHDQYDTMFELPQCFQLSTTTLKENVRQILFVFLCLYG